jgi:fluoride exporter
MKIILLVGFGGFIGSASRYLLSKYVQNWFDVSLRYGNLFSFPYGTLAVNILGCFVLGVLLGLSEKGTLASSEWRLFMMAGICGGFTTFSTFTGENLSFLKDGEFFYFFLYTALSVFLSLLAIYLGHLLTKIVA